MNTEGISIAEVDSKKVKNLQKYEIFSSLSVILKETLAFKNCKISGWQKSAHAFFVKIWVF